MSVELQMRSAHLLWTNNWQTSVVIDRQELVDDDSCSKGHEFTVQSQSESPNSPPISGGAVQGSPSPLENVTIIWNYDPLKTLPFFAWPRPTNKVGILAP